MNYPHDNDGVPRQSDTAKIVIAGGFGVGKTTLICSVSEIEPMVTEASLTVNSVGVDDLDGAQDKRTTTVAMDFGRITFDALVLFLFGTPGQDRFKFMWDDIARGAVGVVILVDTRKLADGFGAIDYFEHQGVPFIIAVNQFDLAVQYDVSEVRRALALDDGVPIVNCDARDRASCRQVLVSLVDHALARRLAHR
ncbi:MAG TPA: ATP/GTP-binding protein [Pseudonocardiaceae bacterium]|nr:ATP/GTP-binding protein [Pseudonocardiaceae bacterium]